MDRIAARAMDALVWVTFVVLFVGAALLVKVAVVLLVVLIVLALGLGLTLRMLRQRRRRPRQGPCGRAAPRTVRGAGARRSWHAWCEVPSSVRGWRPRTEYTTSHQTGATSHQTGATSHGARGTAGATSHGARRRSPPPVSTADPDR